MAARTSGLVQLRSGCSGRNRWRYHWPVGGSHVQAGGNSVRPTPGKAARQLLGSRPGDPGGPGPRRRRGGRRATSTSPAGVVAGRTGLQEPRVLVAGVVGHPVDDDPEAAVVGLGDQAVEVGEGAEQRVDVAVVGHVVAEIGHGRGVERRQPQGVDAQPGQVVEVAADPVEVADPVAGGVAERPRVDLVDDGGLPPARADRGRSRWRWSAWAVPAGAAGRRSGSARRPRAGRRRRRSWRSPGSRSGPGPRTACGRGPRRAACPAGARPGPGPGSAGSWPRGRSPPRSAAP